MASSPWGCRSLCGFFNVNNNGDGVMMVMALIVVGMMRSVLIWVDRDPLTGSIHQHHHTAVVASDRIRRTAVHVESTAERHTDKRLALASGKIDRCVGKRLALDLQTHTISRLTYSSSVRTYLLWSQPPLLLRWRPSSYTSTHSLRLRAS